MKDKVLDLTEGLDLNEGLLVGDEPTTAAPATTTTSNGPAKWTIIQEGKIETEPIRSIKPVKVGLVQKWIINGSHWVTEDPGKNRFISVKEVVIQRGEEKRTTINVEGFLMAEPEILRSEKIALLSENSEIAQALAILLK